ncbi:MAG: glycine zipper 2TM domain-containing protein, partial [Neisseriaceae bacterium]|nr:glycine zipper 2TM domain-containing protein [Neisseriaceae bacterium]
MKANIKYLVIGALTVMVNNAYADMSKTAIGAVVGATACGVAGAVVSGGDAALKSGIACAAVGAAVGSHNDRTDA